MAQFHRRQVVSSSGFAQRTKVVVGHRCHATRISGAAGVADHGAGRRIEAGVISHVAEVAFVTDAEAAAHAVSRVAEYVISKADARRDGAPARLPEAARRTLIGDFDLPTADLLLKPTSRSEIEVRVEVGFVIVLHAIVLPASAVVQGQPGGDLVAILAVNGPVVVSIAAAVGSGADRRLNCAGRARCWNAEVAVGVRSVDWARKLALGIDTGLERNERRAVSAAGVVHHIFKAALPIWPKLLDSLRISAISIIELNVGV